MSIKTYHDLIKYYNSPTYNTINNVLLLLQKGIELLR